MRIASLLFALPVWLPAAESSLLETVRKAGDLYRQGKHEDADKVASEAIAMLESRRDPPDFDGASSWNSLGTFVYAQGDLNRAGRMFARSRNAYLSLAGPSDPRLATVLYNLAGVHVETGHYFEAEPLYHDALAIREKALGPAHPLLAEVWNALGFVMIQQKRYKEALPWLEKAANLWEASAGSAAFAAVALNNLAFLHRLEGSFDKAEALYNRALATEEKHFGQEHPEVATSLLNLAALYRAKGQGEKAKETYRRALVLIEKTLSPQDPLAVETRALLGQLK